MRDRVFILAQRLPPQPCGRAATSAPRSARAVPRWDPDWWDISDSSTTTSTCPSTASAIELTWLEAWQAFVRGFEVDTLPGFPIWVDAFWVPEITPGTPKWKADFLRKNSAFYLEHREFLDGWQPTAGAPRASGSPTSPLPTQVRVAGAEGPTRVRRSRPRGAGRPLPAVGGPGEAPVLPAGAGGHHPDQRPRPQGHRDRLAPPHAAGGGALQRIPFEGFEAGEPDKAIYKQLGNAVNVGVVARMAELLMERAFGVEIWFGPGRNFDRSDFPDRSVSSPSRRVGPPPASGPHRSGSFAEGPHLMHCR